ncbi:reverse transcriptase domain-containing protein [Tanacetum coccineum]|uniref:Reverse transcriptase domain-containing protein n=1 Tax=Tanacetum coccineum TaxID=301880 RepID=A0ABQ5AYX0_9ASTR
MPLDCQLGIVAMWGEWEGFVKWLMECCRVEVWEQNWVLAGFGIGGKVGKKDDDFLLRKFNLRVSYQVQARKRESEDFYTQLLDARTDRRDIRLEVDVVRGQRNAYETELQEMESVFHISGCAIDNQVKFATCTLLGAALTWWNGHVRTLGHDAAYAMTWEILKKKLTDKYCPKGEIKKLEIELWNLKVKGNDVGGYTQRFQELALMCTKFLSDETEKVDKYISGLPDNIHGNVMSARPKTLDDAIELANDLMDQKLRTYAERQAENKRKLDNNNQAQQQLLKKQNVVQAYVVGSGEKKPYGGSKPLCPKCNYHHDGECAPKCTNCKKVGHLTKDCWHPINANNQRTITCYECGNQGHYRSDCPVLKNQGTEARGMVYALGGGETDQDINNMEDDINA